MLRFAHQNYFYLFLLLPLLIIFFGLTFRWKKRAMQRFGSLELMKKLSLSLSNKRQIIKVILLISCVLVMILTLARPQIGTKLEEVKREGVDIVVALDVSLSMHAEDIKPNRLAKAKHEIENFISLLEGDRIGLIAFAGEAFVQCPLTLDYSAAEMFLNIMNSDMIPTPGTNITEVILTSLKVFEQKERKYKVLLIITDGEDHGNEPIEAAKIASKEGIIIYTIGIGSIEGVPIPIYNESGRLIDYKKDRNGQRVTSKLDEITLQKIAQETGGAYERATGGSMELDRIYDRISKMDKKELSSLQFSQYEDRFQYIIIIALLLLVIETAVPERRKFKREWRGRFL